MASPLQLCPVLFTNTRCKHYHHPRAKSQTLKHFFRFTRTFYVSGITCYNLHANMSLFHYFPTLLFTKYQHTRIQTRNTRHHILSGRYTVSTVSLHHDKQVRYIQSAAHSGKICYKTVNLTDLKHAMKFLYWLKILILSITTSSFH